MLATALRFAIGHAVVLSALAAFCWLTGVGLSEAFERWSEVMGGAVLTSVALAALFFPSALRHGHPHLGGHEHTHFHERVPMAAGALMAVSGARALLLALPPLLVGGGFSLSAWTYLPGFAFGVFAGMAGMGILVAEGVRRADEQTSSLIQRASALASAGLGVFWMATRL
jgi:nickel/cobalt transporter (NicO) family protein